MRILVTGHRGYIGGHLYNRLNHLGHTVMGIDLKEGKDVLQDLKEFEQFNPEYIFHLAAFPRVQYSVENPSLTLRNNVLGTSRVLEFAAKVGSKRVIFSSSSAIYGDGAGPTNPYGLHKLMSEQECELYSELYGVDTVCLRYFNVYSSDQTTDGPYSTVIAAWMERLRDKKSLRVDGDGEQRRDFIHVDDIVDINIFCLDYEKMFNGQNYDVGTGENYSLNEIKSFLKKNYNDIEFTSGPARLGDAKETLADIEPLKKIGWQSKVSFSKGLGECF